MHLLDYVVLIGFLVVTMVLSGFFTRREKNTSEYLLAGSKVPWWAIALSYVMAITSTVSLVATPGEAYNNGLRLYMAEWFAPITGCLFFFLFMRFYFAVKTFTPFTYLERRFDHRIRAILSTTFFMSRLTALGMIMFSCGMVFKGIAGWPVWAAIIVIGIAGTIYCTLGGFKAVIWTHVLQFFVLGGGIILTLIMAIHQVDGGASGVVKYAFEHGRGFNFDAIDSGFFSFDPHVRLTFWLCLLSSIHGYMFYNSADQITIQQLLSTSSYKAAKKSFITSVLIFVPMGAILWFIGLSMFAYYGQNPQPSGNPTGDIALFTFVKTKMPSPMPGLLTAAMLAAALGTIGSLIMGLSTVVTKDFYLRFFRPQATEQDQVRLSRITTLLFGAFGTSIALLINTSSSALRETVVEASAIWGAAIVIIAPIFFAGVVNSRCNTVHVLASMAIGLITIVVMAFWYVQSRVAGHPISYMLVGLAGFLVTLISGLVLPFIWKNLPAREKLDNLTIWTLKNSAKAAQVEETVAAK